MSVNMQGWHGISSGQAKSGALLDSNPYRNQEYTVSPWQNFLNSLGIRTQADAWQENMNVQAAEYDAAVAQKMYDNEYNSPVNQVARMRAAGLNPDLSPNSIDSDSSAPMGEDPSTPMQTTGDGDTIATFANGVMSVFSTSLGLVQSMQGIIRNRIQNLLLGTQAEEGFSDFAQRMSLNFLPSNPDNVVTPDGEVSWRSNAIKTAESFAKKSLPKRMQKKFLEEITSFWSGAPNEAKAYELWTKNQEERFKYGMSRSTYGDVTIDDVLYQLTKPLGEAALRQLKATSEGDAKAAENRAQYEGALDATSAAEAQNSQNEGMKATNDLNAILRGTMVQILSGLQESSKGTGVGAGLAKIALALLSAQSLNMLPSLPNFSMSSGVGPKGVSKSTSINF